MDCGGGAAFSAAALGGGIVEHGRKGRKCSVRAGEVSQAARGGRVKGRQGQGRSFSLGLPRWTAELASHASDCGKYVSLAPLPC